MATFLIIVGGLLIVANRVVVAHRRHQVCEARRAIDAFMAQADRIRAVRSQCQAQA